MRALSLTVAFAATVPLANWMIENVGSCSPHSPCVIPVGFGQYAPSGVLVVGAAIVLRDFVQEVGGRQMKHDIKAFAVLENDECTGGIIFAKHAIVARRLGANEYADGEFGSVSCRRAPWADAFVDQKLPAKLMIAHGWHFDCSQCNARITEDHLYDMNLPLEGVIGSQHTHVFCGTRCARKYYSIQRRRQAEEQRAIETFKAIVRQRFPDADFCDEPDAGSYKAAHHAYVVAGRAGWQWRQVSVAFRFDGMKIAPAHFSVMERNNPPEAQYTCCAGDKEAFNAYAQSGGRNNG